MQLHDFAFSSNSRKVRALVYELGITVEPVTVDLRKGAQRDPKFLALNPHGRVPVLVDDGFVLAESNAILAYLAGKAGKLLPTTLRGRAEVDRVLFFQTAHLAPAVGRVAFEVAVKKLAGLGEPDEATVAAGRAEFAAVSRVLDAMLEGREWAAGPLTIADFALIGTSTLALDVKLDVAPYPRVAAWLERMLARESVRRMVREARSFA
jgi:glutathione S-transferase